MEFLNCDIKAIPLDVLMRGLLTIDTNGDVALRVVNNVDSGDNLLDCDLKNLTLEQALRKAIIIDGNGKPAINLATAP
jgi:hypothetical protein